MYGVILVQEWYSDDGETDPRDRLIDNQDIREVFTNTGETRAGEAIINTKRGNVYVVEDVKEVHKAMIAAPHEYFKSIKGFIENGVHSNA